MVSVELQRLGTNFHYIFLTPSNTLQALGAQGALTSYCLDNKIEFSPLLFIFDYLLE